MDVFHFFCDVELDFWQDITFEFQILKATLLKRQMNVNCIEIHKLLPHCAASQPYSLKKVLGQIATQTLTQIV